MFQKFEHIGMAVKSLEHSIPLFEILTGTKCYKREVVESQQVETAFFQIGETKLELLQATGEGSPIYTFIEKKGEGMHHVAYDVDDIHAEMTRLRKEGFRLIYDEPQEGADNKLINFVHPKDSHGMLTEICQERT